MARVEGVDKKELLCLDRNLGGLVPEEWPNFLIPQKGLASCFIDSVFFPLMCIMTSHFLKEIFIYILNIIKFYKETV